MTDAARGAPAAAMWLRLVALLAVAASVTAVGAPMCARIADTGTHSVLTVAHEPVPTGTPAAMRARAVDRTPSDEQSCSEHPVAPVAHASSVVTISADRSSDREATRSADPDRPVAVMVGHALTLHQLGALRI